MATDLQADKSVIFLRVSPALKREIAKQADSLGVSHNEFCQTVIAGHLSGALEKKFDGLAGAMDDVRRWQLAFENPVLDSPQAPPSEDRHELSIELIKEEAKETLRAMRRSDLPEVADGLADTIWVCLTAACDWGIPIEEVWREVRRSNFAKLEKDGKPIRHANGKVKKPDGWEPPDIEGVLRRSKNGACGEKGGAS